MKRCFIKPIVVVSRCLEFEACRYNGHVIASPYVRQLAPHVEFRPICPELEIGLGVPRSPVRIVWENDKRRLIQPKTGKEFTNPLREFSQHFLNTLAEVDGFILKNRSPSCAIRDAKQYRTIHSNDFLGKGPGLFAEEILARWAGLALEDEGRLTNLRLREHFFTKLFLLADFRHVRDSAELNELVQFQTRNKLLLMAYNQSKLRRMGQLVANTEKKPFHAICEAYQVELQQALAHPPKRSSTINALLHILGYFSKNLMSREKALFLENLENYRNEQILLSNVLNILKSWVVRFEEPYLASQTIFFPYPEELMHLSDSGKYA